MRFLPRCTLKPRHRRIIERAVARRCARGFHYVPGHRLPITDHFRVLAFDLPWHGKSNPPEGWQREAYRLTTRSYTEAIRSFCAALDLEKPVVLGCSIGGRIVLNLAIEHAAEFRALIGLEAADYQEPWYDRDWLYRPDVHGEVSAALVSGMMAPQSPDASRWETLWHYMQGGPGIFKGSRRWRSPRPHREDRHARLPALPADRRV